MDYGGRLPVARTGLRTDHGYYYVGIAPTRGLSHRYYEFESGVAGGSERDHSYDGLVSMESVRFGKGLERYAADLQMVASCAFSVPAAPGKPKWTFSAQDSVPIVRAAIGR